MIEGSGSIPLASGFGSGSGRPKNKWIRWIRIRIRNTGLSSNVKDLCQTDYCKKTEKSILFVYCMRLLTLWFVPVLRNIVSLFHSYVLILIILFILFCYLRHFEPHSRAGSQRPRHGIQSTTGEHGNGRGWVFMFRFDLYYIRLSGSLFVFELLIRRPKN